jgi:hypothetical protein
MLFRTQNFFTFTHGATTMTTYSALCRSADTFTMSESERSLMAEFHLQAPDADTPEDPVVVVDANGVGWTEQDILDHAG